jgi:20S proteasome subunit beta 5
MNSLVNRFSTNGGSNQLLKAKTDTMEDDDASNIMWGSEAGFGNIAKGIPTFNVPAVPDVRRFP